MELGKIRVGPQAPRRLKPDRQRLDRYFTPQDRKPESLGLIGLSERARLLGGELRVVATPGSGARLEARIPLP